MCEVSGPHAVSARTICPNCLNRSCGNFAVCVLGCAMSVRHLLTAFALIAVGTVFVGQIRDLLADPTVWPPDDFIEYWSAAKLTIDGQNPYDGKLLLPLQKAGGRDEDQAVMMWNPPWTLAVVFPLGLFPSRVAQLLWLGVNLAATGYSGDRLWRLFGGRADRRWVGWAIAFTAMPSAFALQSGQISPLLLLGAVLFLECERRRLYFAAGAATVLLAIKPHLAYLVWLAILCDAIAHKRWRILIGGAIAGVVCSAFPLIFVPHVWSQFADAMANRPPEQWQSPTIGTVLRLVIDEKLFRLQFVPVLFGLAWFGFYYPRWFARWNWAEQLPLLLLVSFVTAPYGAWPFDMVLLLPAAMWLVIHRCSRLTIAGLVAVNIGCLACNLLETGSFWFLWVSPVVLLLYVIGCRNNIRGLPETVQA
ncbi:MAG: hypothetical protein C0467_06590 [Planctomycetaceae bacterium]|nr:hypothetical protein [Planctomycetaceae bacterium]